MQNAVVLRVMPPLRTQLLIARDHGPFIESAPISLTPVFVTPTREAAIALESVSRPAPEVAFRPAPGRPSPAPAPNASPTRHVPFWLGLRIKLAIILAVGVVALAVLGAERRSIVEIVSCMLVAAGILQLIAVIANGQRA